MRAIPSCGLRLVVGKTSCQRTGNTSLFENDRPRGGLLRGQRSGWDRARVEEGDRHFRVETRLVGAHEDPHCGVRVDPSAKVAAPAQALRIGDFEQRRRTLVHTVVCETDGRAATPT